MSSETELTSGSGTWRYRFAQAVVVATFLLIMAGGNVTSKGAGLAVPDWPMSFGSFNPQGWTSNMSGAIPGVRDEHFHRLVGAAIGLLVTVLAVWLWLREPRAWVRWLGAVTFVGVLVQGGLGGLRVILKTQWHMDQAIWFAIIHGCVAQAFFCLTIALAMVLSPRWPQAPAVKHDAAADQRLRSWTLILAVFVYCQLILGALFRHTGMGLMGIIHVCGALVVAGLLIQAANYTMNRPESQGLARPMITLFLLYGLQVMLGVFAYISVLSMDGRNPANLIQTYVPTLHVAVGAAILGTSFALTFRSHAVTKKRSTGGFPVNMGGEVLA